ncbi:MAG: 1-(5-phosphoribosyl)-5-[(5-phosphoribosylamino)methylideneamino]imidazole-4-carboxamide isomerase [Myxococcales bacterium]|nr:1-(5-phosphoribosyl)-5-[(5-phosphoribosylamino)methylideneamino]imidazole-4-carboxamide isomerase [Myxococcales bacterium]
MLIIPAIDILSGQAVRLHKGLREEVTVFSDNPIELIESFVNQGAERIHIVDLDGAFAGERKHSEIIAGLCNESSVPVEVGGGIRTQEALSACFSDGAQFAVLGTAAIKSPVVVEEACKAYPGRVIVAVDAKDGMVAVEGWVETSAVSATELGIRAAGWGAAALLYTDVSRDGTHAGPNIPATADLHKACGVPVIASGGISSLDDIAALKVAGIEMAVVGRAIYDKHFTVAEAVKTAI